MRAKTPLLQALFMPARTSMHDAIAELKSYYKDPLGVHVSGSVIIVSTRVPISPKTPSMGDTAAICVGLDRRAKTAFSLVRRYTLPGLDTIGRRRCLACRVQSRRLDCLACWRGTVARMLVSACTRRTSEPAALRRLLDWQLWLQLRVHTVQQR